MNRDIPLKPSPRSLISNDAEDRPGKKKQQNILLKNHLKAWTYEVPTKSYHNSLCHNLSEYRLRVK